MPPSVTLVMTMTTCLLMRMPVTHTDVVRWAMDQALPYMDLEVGSRLGEYEPLSRVRWWVDPGGGKTVCSSR